jgi:hypothetical protein
VAGALHPLTERLPVQSPAEETCALADIPGDERLVAEIVWARSVMIKDVMEKPGPDLG